MNAGSDAAASPGIDQSDAGTSRGNGSRIGATVTLAELEGGDPHPLLARLREHEPVAWLPVLDGWLVTRRDLALAVMRDDRTFTVDDPRFTTARVVGPSMLRSTGPSTSVTAGRLLRRSPSRR